MPKNRDLRCVFHPAPLGATQHCYVLTVLGENTRRGVLGEYIYIYIYANGHITDITDSIALNEVYIYRKIHVHLYGVHMVAAAPMPCFALLSFGRFSARKHRCPEQICEV